MPRQARIDLPGLLQHVMVRGIEKKNIFLDDEDRVFFLARFSRLLIETETACFAWALMSNHFHLLLIPSKHTVGNFMRRLLTGYAVNFNRKHGRVGHLFQNRYKFVVCEEDPYLLELIRYIHLNPLRAGLVKALAELDDYPWSGHAVLLGKRQLEGQVVDDVLSLWGHTPATARKAYRKFVADGIAKGKRDELTGGGLQRSQGPDTASEDRENFDARVLGSGAFVERLYQERLLRPAPSIRISELINQVGKVLEIEPADIRRPAKKRHLAAARGIVCYLAVDMYRHKGIDLGSHLRLTPSGVSLAARRGEKFLQENPSVKARILEGIVK